MFDLNRSMANHLQQLFVRPDICFKGGDVKITDHDHPVLLFVLMAQKPARHLGQVGQFLAEFGVDRTVGDVSACRDIKIVERHCRPASRGTGDSHREVPRFAGAVEIVGFDSLNGNPRKRSNPVIGFLTIQFDVIKAQSHKCFGRKLVIGALDFLQAQNIGLIFLYEFLDQMQPWPDRIDVPGRKREFHEKCSLWLSWKKIKQMRAAR